MQSFGVRVVAFLAGVWLLAFSATASADPPSRVARLGYASGAVSLSPAGENDWVQATLNRPLTIGDRLWVDAGARAEIQDGGAMIRLNGNTSLSVLNLDEYITQLQLTQGVLNVRVRRLAPNQVFEVDTPNLALTLRYNGNYRIAVDADGNTTEVIVREGQGEVMGEDSGYIVDAQQRYRFRGSNLHNYEFQGAPGPDEFDRWTLARDRAFDNSVSARYVSRDVVGYQDLDANGQWHVDQTWGNVWTPNRVQADWAPYRDGHWAWIDPWGWTWVDDAPWGFVVSHYGRWVNLGRAWSWVPGPQGSSAYYAPALVAFVAGDAGGVAWFPLAPREVYRPAYSVSRGYFENINRSNTVINNTVINNSFNTTSVSNVIYANRRIPGAVIAVPKNAFVQSLPVPGARLRATQEQLAGAPVTAAPHVAPTEQSLRGAGAARQRPAGRAFERPVFASAVPPTAHLGFAAQQQQLTLSPGKPLDEASRRELRPAAVPTSNVKVLASAPVAPQPQVVPRQIAPPAPAAPAESRGPGVQRGNGPQRVPVAAAPVASAPPAQAAPAQAVAPAPTPQGPRNEPVRVIRPAEPALPVLAPRPPAALPVPPPAPSRAPEPKPAAAPAVPPPPHAAASVPAPKAENTPAARTEAPRAPVAAPKPAPPVPAPASDAAAKAEPRGPRAATAHGKQNDTENGRDPSAREEENRKLKN
jgi:hypothetical protein